MDEGIKRLIELGINATPALRELEKLGVETRKQTESIDGLQGKLTSFANTISSAFKGIAIYEVVKQVVGAIGTMIDKMDELDESAQQIGLTVEKVQELQYAMSFSGIDSGQSMAALGRFSDKLAEIGDESNDTSRKLREMGITATDDVNDAMLKMAEVFSKAPDGIEKTALAIEIFGRNLGLKLIPFLNEGAAGLEKLQAQSSAFGNVSSETAKQAAEFNDQMGQLSKAVLTIGQEIVADLLPPLNDFLKWCISVIGPIKTTIKFLGDLDDKINVMAIAARTLAQARALVQGDTEALGELSAAYSKAISGEPKAGGVPTALTDIQKFGKAAEDAAKKFAMIPKEIALLQEKMSFLDPSVKGDALLLQSYTKQLEGLQKQLEGTTKAAAGKKLTPPKLDEWDSWVKSIGKLGDTAALVPEKIKYLQEQIAALGSPKTEKAKLYLEALEKALAGLVKADAGAEAVKKLAEEAQKLDDAPKVIAAIEAEIVKLEAAGPPAGEAVSVLRGELLKMKAAKDPVAAVTLELEKLHDTMKRNAAIENEFFARLGSKEGLTHEEFVQVNKFLTDNGTKLEDNTKKAKELGEAVSEMGAKFVTDWVDKVVDGLGKTEVAFGEMIDSFLRQLLKLLMNQQMAKLISLLTGTAASGGGGIGGLTGGFSTQSFSVASDQQGDDLMRGGGALASPTFTRTVGYALVAAPTAMATGSGGAAAAASPVTVNVHNNTPAEVTTQTKDNADGSRQIEIFIEQKVKGMFTNGQMDRTMRQGYGLTRQPIAG